MERDPSYDPQTQTVAADDGSRLSVWESDDCPKCGADLVFWLGEPGPDLAMCRNALGFAATCDLILTREAVR